MNEIWKKVQDLLRQRTNERNYNLWFRPLEPVHYDDTNWTLAAPNRFLKDWITDNYLDILERTLYEATGKESQIQINVGIHPTSGLSKATDSGAPSAMEAFSSKQPAIKKKKRKKRPHVGMPLNDHFLFSNFVAGPSNEFARAACMAVAKEPGDAYNPLFLYGETGLGKTHLLQAISHDLLKRSPDTRIAYITAERFMTELIQAIANNQTVEFRRRYRDQCDILLMDDIQFIAGKTSTQSEFFHTFNFLFESGKQVVVTSDQYPHDIKAMDERIRSRLGSGLVADIKTPDIETRLAILQRKTIADNFSLADDVLEFLATNIRSNVRELEGSYIRLKAFASLTNTTIDVAAAKEILKGQIRRKPAGLTSENIQKRVSRYFNISQSDMLSKSRARKVVVPRQIAMFLTKKYTGMSLSDIGKNFSGKDHATVINSIHRVEKMMSDDMNIRSSVEALEKQIND